MEQNLYDILEVSNTASEAEIKKAYRKKALIYHPDKGGDEEEFKKIRSAYEVLSDPVRKQEYDRPKTSVFHDLLKNLSERLYKTETMVYQHQVSLEDICTRKTAKIEVERKRVCPCTRKQNSVCSECKGKGYILCSRRVNFFFIQEQRKCTVCQGSGKLYTSCEDCENGIMFKKKTFELHLAPSLENGFKITFKNEGNQEFNKVPGDLTIVLLYKKHDFFTLEGKNIICQKSITLKESLCGFHFSFTHPSGEVIAIRRTDVTKPGSKQILYEKGMDTESFLRIIYRVKFPEKLTEKQKVICSKIL